MINRLERVMGYEWRLPAACRLEGYDDLAGRQHFIPAAMAEHMRYLLVMGLTEEAAERFLREILETVARNLVQLRGHCPECHTRLDAREKES